MKTIEKNKYYDIIKCLLKIIRKVIKYIIFKIIKYIFLFKKIGGKEKYAKIGFRYNSNTMQLYWL